MQLDARTLPDRVTLEVDLCIVGAGPTGLSLAAEFADTSTTVLVLESGSWDAEPAVASLNSAATYGDAYDGLQKSRHRQIGGTARIWNTPLAPGSGAKYVPLDPIDFRGEHGRPRWPVEFETLVPYYRRAQRVAGLGPFDYEAVGWQLPRSPIPDDHPTLAPRIYQFGSSNRFCDHLPRLLVAAENITLCSSATATRMRWRGDSVEALEAMTSNHRRLTVRLKRLVLAQGGVENARMLLLAAQSGHVHDRCGWLGRGFMEHPRDYSLVLDTTSRRTFERLEFFDARAVQGTTVCGRLALKDRAILDDGLPNASVTFLPMGRQIRPFHWRVVDLAWRRFGWDLSWPPGYGWSRLPAWARRFDGFQLLINLEEYPNPDNRLELDSSCDQFGVNRVRLHRSWSQEDVGRLCRLRDLLAQGMRDMALGPLTIGPLVTPDPNSHHHMGTTRMGADSTTGVADSFGQVFGTDNLFVVGASLFPAGGYANPTLTAIALALRLADRLASNP